MARVLLVEDSRTQALQIQYLLEDGEFEVTVAGDGVQALAALAKSRPDVVLTDLDMPEMNGLELVEEVRGKYPGLPVVLMTALGSEEIAVRALRSGAASYVPKKILPREILATLDSVLTVAQAMQQEKRVLECLTLAEFQFVLDNDPALVGPLIGYLEESALRMLHCDRTELMRVGIALQEALLNAMFHGNLEVSSELRQEGDERTFHEMAKARRGVAPYRDRRVHVRVSLSNFEATYVVTDEGPGFNPLGLPDPTDPTNLERIGGRGLMLIRTFMDRVEHNPRGNEITMTKKARPKGA